MHRAVKNRPSGRFFLRISKKAVPLHPKPRLFHFGINVREFTKFVTKMCVTSQKFITKMCKTFA